jgi:cytochrome c-type biogenesis protein
MTEIQSVSLTMAFLAGLLSFLSPCVLPLVPSFVVYITGISFEQLTQERPDRRMQRTALTHAVSFILGFSCIFILLGASATAAGQWLLKHQIGVQRVGGVLIALFGLFMMGAFPLRVLMAEKRFHLDRRPAGLVGTFFVGSAFAAGWTPCVGPILGSILLVASMSESIASGIALLTAYSLGLGIPLLIAAAALGTFLARMKRVNRFLKPISVFSGSVLVLLGILFFTNAFSIFTGWLTEAGFGWTLEQ